MNWRNILIVVLALAVVYFIWYNSTRTCYYLPKTHDPDKFGPYYWLAIHSIIEKIPCPACRDEAVPLFSFVHDLVNHKLEKPLYDKDNFYKHVSEISKIK